MSTQKPTSLRHRQDIDGLRAFAVISVVMYHAFPQFLRGGFVGVDVFFVISGYLISHIILSDIDSNDFSFKKFYGRRIRRIFPSLLVVLLSSFVVGWFTMQQEDYAGLGGHVASASVFASNFTLWGEAGVDS